MTKVYLGLGSNVGSCLDNLASALTHLEKKVTIVACSSILRTEPLYVIDQPDFYNQVICIETNLAPLDLLFFIKSLEKEIGRVPTFLYGPRVIDIDILYYDDLIIHDQQLQIPHPKNNERVFILKLMNELDPIFTCPITKIPLKAIHHMHDLIEELLISTFNDRSDKIVEKILKDSTSFQQALKISEEADYINLHTSLLSSLRVKILDVLVGIIRDFDKAQMILSHLQRDFDNDIQLNKEDEILYNTNLFLFSLIYNPDFDKGIIFGKKALALLESEPEMIEEKLRLFSNLIQYYSLIGLFDEAQTCVEKGISYFKLSQSDAYNALYVLATTVFLNEQGKFEQVISLIKEHRALLERQTTYPTMYSFTWIQLCEALIKTGDFKEAEKTLALTEKIGREFYTHENNTFFAKLFTLQALINSSKREHFISSKILLEKALKIYDDMYCGPNKHKNQASVHFFLGQLYFFNQQNEKAAEHGLLSKKIYDIVLKSKKCYDVIELSKLLTRLEVEMSEMSVA